jgi:hypothetical protein
MDIVHARCAGLDVHKQTVVACVRVAAASTANHAGGEPASTPCLPSKHRPPIRPRLRVSTPEWRRAPSREGVIVAREV